MGCPGLRLLSIVVGGLNIFTSIGFTISIIISLCYYDNKEFQNAEFATTPTASTSLLCHGCRKDMPSHFDDLSCLVLVTMAILLFLSAVWISFSIMLIVGICQDRYRLMACWIYFQIVSIGFVLLLAVVDVVKEVLENISFNAVFLEFVVVCLITGVVALCLYPVVKLYNSMRLLAQQPQRHDWRRINPTSRSDDVLDQSKSEGDT